MLSLEEKLQALPKSPGVYLFKDDQGKVIYIGKALVLRNRVRQYFQQGHDGRYQYELLVGRIADVEVITTDTELEALILENTLIRERKPRYNIDLRDDKSFPFLRISHEQFPRVFLTRHPVQDGSRYFGPYSDLFLLKGLLHVLRGMLKIRTCNLALTEDGIAKKKFKACLQYHIGRCDAPCIGNETREQYGKRIQDFTDVVLGRGGDVIQHLRHEMDRLAEETHFEQAVQIRDWLSALDNLTQRQKVISAEPINRDIIGLAIEDDIGCLVVMQVRGGRLLGRLDYRLKQLRGRSQEEILETALQRYFSEPVSVPDELFLPFAVSQSNLFTQWLSNTAGRKITVCVPARGGKAQLVDMAGRNAELLLAEYLRTREKKERIPHALQELQRHLRLNASPRLIAAFDISTLMGTDKVASMIMFENGRPARSQYRRFKIKSVAGMDDFASMKEAVSRRFARLLKEEQAFPDLVLVDGGKGQLAAAIEALMALGIHEQPVIGLAKRLEEIFIPNDARPYNLPKTSSALKLLQQIRDEAHRFAITYHRQIRRKRSLRSLLDEIDGIGPTRRAALVSHFGSVKAIEQAKVDDIIQVEGIPQTVAESVFRFFQERQQSQDSRTDD